MTLSRRDEFAARAMAALLANPSVNQENIDDVAVDSVSYGDATITELGRTAPKTERAEIEDDGRALVCTEENFETATVTRSNPTFAGQVRLRADVALTVTDARLYAQRIIKLCDEIEGVDQGQSARGSPGVAALDAEGDIRWPCKRPQSYVDDVMSETFDETWGDGARAVLKRIEDGK